MRRADSSEKTLMLGKIEGRRRRDDRGRDGWMASSTQWTWVWVDSRSWWWTGRPDVLQFMGSQRVGHDWVTELNWTQLRKSRDLNPGTLTPEAAIFHGNYNFYKMFAGAKCLLLHIKFGIFLSEAKWEQLLEKPLPCPAPGTALPRQNRCTQNPWLRSALGSKALVPSQAGRQSCQVTGKTTAERGSHQDWQMNKSYPQKTRKKRTGNAE